MHKGKYYIILTLIVFVTAFLRIYNIEQKNMWFDEVYSWDTSQKDLKQIVITSSGDIHPPLFYVVLKYWTSAFSDSVFSMRMLSVLLSMLSIFFILKICNALNLLEREKLFSLLLYAVCSLNIYYSQEVRMQSLTLLLTLSSVYFFIRLINDAEGKNKFSLNGLYILFTFLSFYTHYFTALIFAAQVAYALFLYFRKEMEAKVLLKLSIGFASSVVLFLPWFNVLLEQIFRGQPWRKSQTFPEVCWELLKYFRDLLFSVYNNFVDTVSDMSFSIICILLITSLIFFGLRLAIRRQRDVQKGIVDKRLFLFFLIFIPLTIAFVVSFRQSIIFSRYLSTLVPYICMLLSVMLFRIPKSYLRYISLVFVTGIFLYGVRINYGNTFKYNDYRKVINFIRTYETSKDYNLIIDPHYLGWIVKYENLHSKEFIQKPDVFGWDLKMQMDSLSKRPDIKNLWMILDYSTMNREGYDRSDTTMTELGFRKENEKYFYIYPEKVKVVEYRKPLQSNGSFESTTP